MREVRGISHWSVEIPANTRGTVRLPKAPVGKVTEGGKPLTDAGIRVVQSPADIGQAIVDVLGSKAAA